MNTSIRISAARRLLPLLLLPMATQTLAQQHAHTHGRLALDVAVDAQKLTLRMEAPLDNLLGFERAPRTDAERKRVAAMVQRLRAADSLFIPDPKAECRLINVTLASEVLGLDKDAKPADATAAPQPSAPSGHANHDEHADIDISIVFNCAKAAQARQIEVRMFDAFPRLRQIDAQVASEQGQFKRSLSKAAPVLRWGR